KSRSGFRSLPPLSLLVAINIILAGCAGAPPREEALEPEPPLAPPAPEVILDAQVHAQNSDFKTAAAILEDLINREPGNIEALKLLASVYTVIGRRNDAVSIWKKVSILDPSDSDASYKVGVILARKRDWTGVRSKMLAAESAGGSESRHYLLLGEADLELGYIIEAEKYLKRAVSLERARCLLGGLYYEQGKLSKAEKAFTEVLQRNPDNFSAHLHLGWLHYARGNLLKSLKHYKNAVRLKSSDPLARLSLAGLLEEMKRPNKAIEHYKAALSLPDTPRSEKKKAYNSLSRLLVERDRTAEAISLIESGLAEFPGSGGLYYQWGEAMLREEKKDEAREKFRRAAEDPVWRKTALHRIHTIP
ncbi:MAG: tetratricopeptide repeat protein, partial [Candidatus Krumholzibacteria bacterium]|nr:tetratricopeptide repeat protein [Candidatus Krumholzibacteria bacterium]